jgi:hypothetical protein
VGDVHDLADFEVDSYAANSVGLLRGPATFAQAVDHIEERVPGRQRDVF